MDDTPPIRETARGQGSLGPDDAALIREAAGGDERSFELLVRRHTEALWRLARTMLRDDGAAEEAVQDTFLNAYRALASFRGEASPRTWLLAICHRVCLDRLRSRRAVVVPLDRVRERARTDHHDLRIALEAALESLPPPDRLAFVLVDVAGYSREEAARIVGVPSSTMRSRVARARERLVRLLAEPRAAAKRS